MTAFSGKHYFTLDSKGRVIIPAPFRDIIFREYNSPKLYITNAVADKCLHIYPIDEWQKMIEEKVRRLPKTDPNVKFFIRRVIASAVECEIDRQGRVLIPAALREDAEIRSEIAIVGSVERLELWDKSRWYAVSDPARVDIQAVEAALAQHGL